MRHLRLALLLTVTLGALLPARARGQAPRGALVILGGEPGGDSINTRFVRLARAAGPGPVVILPMANADPAKDVLARTRIFQSLGVATIALDLTRESAGSDSVARILGQASGIWFTGGSQNRLAAALLGTAALDSVRARYLGDPVLVRRGERTRLCARTVSRGRRRWGLVGWSDGDGGFDVHWRGATARRASRPYRQQHTTTIHDDRSRQRRHRPRL